MKSPGSIVRAGRLVGVWHGTLRSVLLGVLAVYLGWNAWWLSHGRLAPSLLLALTEIPAPTTGGTRAIVALLHGDLLQSLRYNAMAVPLCAVLAASLCQLGYQAVRKQRLRLAKPVAWSWLAVLTIAWLAKLFVSEPT